MSTGLWIDAEGKEHELITAERDLVVTDPQFGFDRQIIAGQHVPPELQDAYEQKIKRSSSSSSSGSSSSGGQAKTSGSSSSGRKSTGKSSSGRKSTGKSSSASGQKASSKSSGK